MKNVYAALFEVQGKVLGAQKNAKNPHFKNAYTNLEGVWNALRGPLQTCGLVVMQAPGTIEAGYLTVTTTIAHAESGEHIENVMQIPISKGDAQGVGSAITYACRYALMALFGIPPVDDDGEAARAAFERTNKPALQPGADADLIAWHARNRDKVDGDYIRAVEAHWSSIKAIKDGIATNDLSSACEAWLELGEASKGSIWKAPTKGGCFTRDEVAVIKSTEFREAGFAEA